MLTDTGTLNFQDRVELTPPRLIYLYDYILYIHEVDVADNIHSQIPIVYHNQTYNECSTKDPRRPRGLASFLSYIFLGSVWKGSGTEQNICNLPTVLIIAHVIKHQRTFGTTHIKKI